MSFAQFRTPICLATILLAILALALASSTAFAQENDSAANQPPQFSEDRFSFNMKENRGRGWQSKKAIMKATDPDGSSDAITYAITDGNPSCDQCGMKNKPYRNNLFRVSKNAVITYQGSGEDYEAFPPGQAKYELTVTATDQGGATASVTVTINILDILENTSPDVPENTSPEITNKPTNEIIEVAENTTGVLYAFTASDADGDAITWSLSSDADGASFVISNDPTTAGQLTAAGGAVLNYEERVYYYFVVTVHDGIDVDTAEIALSVTDVAEMPSAPAAPTVQAASTTSLTVDWKSPENTGPPIKGYEVQYCESVTDCDEETKWRDAGHQGTGLSASIGDLTDGTAYQVRVRASNREGIGPWSPGGMGSTPSANTAPEITDRPADGIIEVAENTTGVLYTFTASDADGDAITWSLSGADGASFVISSDAATAGQLTLASDVNLDYEGKSAYTFTVTASDGIVANTAEVSLKVTNVAELPGRPAEPASVEGNEQITMSWSEPANEGPPIAGYVVQWKSGSQDYHEDREATTTGTSYTITGLTNGVAYTARVRAGNADGDGGWSDESSATPDTLPTAPDAPTLEADNGQIAVSWSEPANEGSAIIGYTIQWKMVNPVQFDPSALDWTPSSQWWIHNGEVHVHGSWGDGRYAQVHQSGEDFKATVWLTDDTLMSPALATLRQAKIWSEHVIAHYADWKSVHQDYGSDRQATTADIAYEIAGLANGMAYAVRVKAVNASGESGWSGEVNATPNTPPDAPGAPTLLPVDKGTIKASWTKPANDGSPIINYMVEWREANGIWDDGSATVAGASKNISGLAMTTKWHVKVKACNAAGCSDWSDESYAALTKPNPPQSVVLQGGLKQITVSWDAPQDNGSGPVTGYRLSWNPEGDLESSEYKKVGPTLTSYTITGLPSDTTYDVRVKAINALDTGPAASEPTQATTARPPASPGLSIDTGGKPEQIRARWDAPADDGVDIESYTVQWNRGEQPNSVSGWYVYNGVHIKGAWNDRPYAEVRAKSGGYAALVLMSDESKQRSDLLDTLNDAKLWAQRAMWWDGAAEATVPADPAPEPDSQYSHVATGLEGDGAKYSLRVRATSAAGAGPWANGSTSTASPPDAPENFSIYRYNQSKTGVHEDGSEKRWFEDAFYVSWGTSADNGAPITHYLLQWREGESEGKVENDPYGWPSDGWWKYNGAHVYGGWGYWPYAEVHDNSSSGQGWRATVWLDESEWLARTFDGDGHWPAKNWAEYEMWWGGDDVDQRTIDGSSSDETIMGETYYLTTYSFRLAAVNPAGRSSWSGNFTCYIPEEFGGVTPGCRPKD